MEYTFVKLSSWIYEEMTFVIVANRFAHRFIFLHGETKSAPATFCLFIKY